MSQGDTLAETLADKLKLVNAHAGQHGLAMSRMLIIVAHNCDLDR